MILNTPVGSLKNYFQMRLKSQDYKYKCKWQISPIPILCCQYGRMYYKKLGGIN